MIWQEIYKKHKDSELMKEFLLWWLQYFEEVISEKKAKLLLSTPAKETFQKMLSEYNIKDIWGYLICFAETKGYRMHPNDNDFICIEKLCKKCGWIVVEETKVIPTEQAMLWCADKFFEVTQ